jgi:hypothetical protein
MKYIYLFIFSAISFASKAQFQFSAGYSMGVPQKELADNINLLHSISLSPSATIPGTGGRLQAGVDLTWGTYANTTKEQTFTFTNGSTTRTDVNYSSNVLQVGVNAKLFAFKNSPVNLYASGKAGYASFYSNIFIEDPHDPGGCKALDQKNLIKDGTFMAGYGAGLQIDMSVFSPRALKGFHFIDLSVSRNSGGEVDYINTKKLYDANDPATTTGGSKPLNVKFINATTQQIHEHQVAEVYNSPMRFLEFKLSTTFKINSPEKYRKSRAQRGCSSKCHH